MNGHRIVTQYIFPPIPVRTMDWQATLEDYDGAPDAGPQPMGWGETEQAAILDLLESLT